MNRVIRNVGTLLLTSCAPCLSGHGDGAVQQEAGKHYRQRAPIDMVRNQRRNQGPGCGRQFQGHSQAYIGDVTLHIKRGCCSRGSDHCDEADADGRMHRQAIVDGQQRSNDDASADAGDSAKTSSKKTYGGQQEDCAQAHLSPSRRGKVTGSSLESARKVTPTEPSTTMVATSMVSVTPSLPISAPSSTATAGTNRLMVEKIGRAHV